MFRTVLQLYFILDTTEWRFKAWREQTADGTRSFILCLGWPRFIVSLRHRFYGR